MKKELNEKDIDTICFDIASIKERKYLNRICTDKGYELLVVSKGYSCWDGVISVPLDNKSFNPGLKFNKRNESFILVEMKIRNCNSTEYMNEGLILEKQKYQELVYKRTRDNLDGIFYINVFNDGCYIIFNLSTTDIKFSDSKTALNKQTVVYECNKIIKEVAYIKYKEDRILTLSKQVKLKNVDSFFDKYEIEKNIILNKEVRRHISQKCKLY